MIPHAPELESCIIGATILSGSIPYNARELGIADFYGRNRQIWAAILALDEDREGVDPFAILKVCKLDGLTVKELMDTTLGAIELGTREIRMLQQVSLRRQVQKEFSDLSYAVEDETDANKLLDRAQALIDQLKSDKKIGKARSYQDVLIGDTFEGLDKYVSGDLVRYPFGFSRLDAATSGGAAPGELIVFGAKPKSGKSILGLQIVRHQAAMGIPWYICSREMSNRENGFRMIAHTTKFSMNTFSPRSLTGNAELAEDIKREALAHQDLPIYFDQWSSTVKQIRQEIDVIYRQTKRKPNVWVDYTQLMRSEINHRITAELINEVIMDLKNLAQDEEIVVAANAQFNREGIKNDRPKMSDFKGSSTIEMAANLIVLWTIEDEYNRTYNGRPGTMWIEAGRNAAFDEWGVVFKGEKARFEERL